MRGVTLSRTGRQNAADNGIYSRVARARAVAQPVLQLRVGAIEQAVELFLRGRIERAGMRRRKLGQQHIEFLRAAAAAPHAAFVRAVHAYFFARGASATAFLISAMAFAGFNPFGQAFAQFMMVWQR